MTTEQEVARLRHVYGTYRRTATIQARSDAANAGNRAILAERASALHRLLAERGYLPLADRRVLEVGCNSGDLVASWVGLGARPENLCGVDLLPDRIAEARRRYPRLRWEVANAEALDFPAASFDLVLVCTVVSSILDDRMARNLAAETVRVLAPGGAIVWYDLRVDNPANPHVRGIPRARIAELFSGLELHLRTLTLVPPLARRLGRLAPVLYPALAAVPWLRTHHLGLLCKRGHDGTARPPAPADQALPRG